VFDDVPAGWRNGGSKVWILSVGVGSIERMFGMLDAAGLDAAGLDAAELDAEERFVWEYTEAGLAADPVWEAPVLPAGVDSWPVGLSLAMLLWSVDVDELSAADRVRFLRAQER
jgi:hypothetical protein